jgi:hypothetical protein
MLMKGTKPSYKRYDSNSISRSKRPTINNDENWNNRTGVCSLSKSVGPLHAGTNDEGHGFDWIEIVDA